MIFDARPGELNGPQQVYSRSLVQHVSGYHELVTALRRGWNLEKAWPLPKNKFRRVGYYLHRIQALNSIELQLGPDHPLHARVRAWTDYTRWLMVWFTHDIGFPSAYSVGSLQHILYPERTRYSTGVSEHKNTLLYLFRTPEHVRHDHALPYWLHEYNWWFHRHMQCAYFVQHALWCSEIIKCIQYYLSRSNLAHVSFRDMDIAKAWYSKWIRGREATEGKSNAHWVTPEKLHAQHLEEWKWIQRFYNGGVGQLGLDATNEDSVAAWLCLKTCQLWHRYNPSDSGWMQQYDHLVRSGEKLLASFALECVTTD